MELPVSRHRLGDLIQRHHADVGRILALRLRPEWKGQYEHWDHGATSPRLPG